VRHALALLLAAAAALAASGCGGGDDDKGLVFKDPRGTVDVEEGMRFTFEFRVNAGVGFDWRAVGVPEGVALVVLKETEVEYPEEDRAGDSGDKRFIYEALRPGRQTLVFRRLFRGDLDERRTLTVVIAAR
jgi:predicted secreted protein